MSESSQVPARRVRKKMSPETRAGFEELRERIQDRLEAERLKRDDVLNPSVRTRMSMVEEAENTPEGRRDMAAARATLSTLSLVSEAFERSGLTREEFAARLGVSVERVDQILDGDGNLRVTTIARIASVLGYSVEMFFYRGPVGDEPETLLSRPGRW